MQAAAVTPPSVQQQQTKPSKSINNNSNNPYKKKKKNNNASANNTNIHPRMKVEKNIIDELLLVCGVIGTTTTTTTTTGANNNTDTTTTKTELIPVTDCLNWLQDLQRVLRRDDDIYRPISLLIGKWNIIPTKLLPLVATCGGGGSNNSNYYDEGILLTILKILVIVTKPLARETQNAAKLIIDTKKTSDAVIQQQVVLRDNALQQVDMLMEFKRAVTYFQKNNHHKNNGSGGGNNGGGGILSVFMALLSEPLSKTGTSRTPQDHLTIELVLHLIRNLLAAEPIFRGNQNAFCCTGSNNKRTYHNNRTQSTQLHNDLICLLDQELVLEVLLVISQEMELRENVPYNLLIMELLHHLLKSQDPTIIARCGGIADTISGSATSNKSNHPRNKNNTNHARTMTKNPNASLRSQLLRDKQKYRVTATSRHAHFGGTLQLDKTTGPDTHDATEENGGGIRKKRKYISTHDMNQLLKDPNNNTQQPQSQQTHKRLKKNKKHEPFLGSGRTLASHTRNGYGTCDVVATEKVVRAQRVLYQFCSRFLTQCYGPVMKSLKNEFRRDSSRLEDCDKVIFFRLVWFFFQWYRQQQQQKCGNHKNRDATDPKGSKNMNDTNKKDDKNNNNYNDNEDDNNEDHRNKLIFTMDVFTYNLVLNSIDTFIERKQYTRLAQTVALYNEMMQFLLQMYVLHQNDNGKNHSHSNNDNSSDNKDEDDDDDEEPSVDKLMAMGLMDRLFYNADPVDKLPKLLSTWQPSMSTREYCCDIVDLCHVTLKLLELNESAATSLYNNHNEENTNPPKGNEKPKNSKSNSHDIISRMISSAMDFEVRSYFVKKIVSNNVVFMYTKLLEQYLVNAPHVNHRITSFLLRLTKVRISSLSSDDDEDALGGNNYPNPDNNNAATTTLDDHKDENTKAEQKKQQKLRLISGSTVVTLEPMLYNIRMIMVYQAILNDKSIRNDPLYNAPLSFAAKIIRNFYWQTQKNPVLFIECLLRHPQPHQFCQSSTNLYVNEELRMIAEKELLLEEYNNNDNTNENDRNNDMDMDDDNDNDDVDGGKNDYDNSNDNINNNISDSDEFGSNHENNTSKNNPNMNTDSDNDINDALEQRQRQRERLQRLQQKQRQLKQESSKDTTNDDDDDEIEFMDEDDDIIYPSSVVKNTIKSRQENNSRSSSALLEDSDSDDEVMGHAAGKNSEKKTKKKKLMKLRRPHHDNSSNSNNGIMDDDGDSDNISAASISASDDDVDFGNTTTNDTTDDSTVKDSGDDKVSVTQQQQQQPHLSAKKRFVIDDDEDE